MNNKKILYLNSVEESKDNTIFEGSLQSKMFLKALIYFYSRFNNLSLNTIVQIKYTYNFIME